MGTIGAGALTVSLGMSPLDDQVRQPAQGHNREDTQRDKAGQAGLFGRLGHGLPVEAADDVVRRQAHGRALRPQRRIEGAPMGQGVRETNQQDQVPAHCQADPAQTGPDHAGTTHPRDQPQKSADADDSDQDRAEDGQKVHHLIGHVMARLEQPAQVVRRQRPFPGYIPAFPDHAPPKVEAPATLHQIGAVVTNVSIRVRIVTMPGNMTVVVMKSSYIVNL